MVDVRTLTLKNGFCGKEVYTWFFTANVSVSVRYGIACGLSNCCLPYSVGGEVAASARRLSHHYLPYTCVSQTFFAVTLYACLLMA
jgi:hypothetical protein